MDLRGKKLGLLLSAAPDQPNFERALFLAETAAESGVTVLFYCLDEAVTGLSEPRLQALRARGVRLFACAHAARQRGIAPDDSALFTGLTMLGDLMTASDRFVSFN
jgi:sulfur relay (sulfurtransferase) complex TusBCD TusD component (DsrE family)